MTEYAILDKDTIKFGLCPIFRSQKEVSYRTGGLEIFQLKGKSHRPPVALP